MKPLIQFLLVVFIFTACNNSDEQQTVEAQASIVGEVVSYSTEEQVSNLTSAMEEAGVDFNYISYEGVKHSFTNPEATARGEEFGLPLEYNEEADRKSWETMKNFFEETFSEE